MLQLACRRLIWSWSGKLTLLRCVIHASFAHVNFNRVVSLAVQLSSLRDKLSALQKRLDAAQKDADTTRTGEFCASKTIQCYDHDNLMSVCVVIMQRTVH